MRAEIWSDPALSKDELSRNVRDLYVALAIHTDKDRECRLKHKTLAETTGMSVSTVKRTIKEAERIGLVEVTPHTGYTNEYRLNDGDDAGAYVPSTRRDHTVTPSATTDVTPSVTTDVSSIDIPLIDDSGEILEGSGRAPENLSSGSTPVHLDDLGVGHPDELGVGHLGDLPLTVVRTDSLTVKNIATTSSSPRVRRDVVSIVVPLQLRKQPPGDGLVHYVVRSSLLALKNAGVKPDPDAESVLAADLWALIHAGRRVTALTDFAQERVRAALAECAA